MDDWLAVDRLLGAGTRVAPLPRLYVYPDPLTRLGVKWDSRLCFMDHISGILTRAGVRHAVMARLVRSSWGLEVGVLRTTHAAPLVSLTGYGLVTVNVVGLVKMGSGAYELGIRRLKAQLANISARQILGIGRPARLAALHMSAGVVSVRNQYIKACALMLDRAPRAYNSAIQLKWSRGCREPWECRNGGRGRHGSWQMLTACHLWVYRMTECSQFVKNGGRLY